MLVIWGDWPLSVFDDRAVAASQPREVLTMLAARAALRVLPFAQMGKCVDYRGVRRLPLFCAGAVSWTAAKYPAFETNLAAQAAAAIGATFSNPAMAARLRPFISPEIFFSNRLTNASEDAARAAILLALRGKHGTVNGMSPQKRAASLCQIFSGANYGREPRHVGSWNSGRS